MVTYGKPINCVYGCMYKSLFWQEQRVKMIIITQKITEAIEHGL